MRIENRNEAVYAVQTYLYELGLKWDWLPAIHPNGVYGDNTKEAVRIFQGRFDLPVTGEVDFDTWSLLYSAYRDTKEGREILPSPSIPKADFPLTIGSKGYGVVLLRATLNELAEYYPSLPRLAPTSLYQYSTASAVRTIERIYRLSETGAVDIPLWNRLHLDLTSKQALTSHYDSQNKPLPLS